MMIEIRVPSPGESISEVQVASWFYQNGDYVEKDAEIAEIDSDKATLTITAEASGILQILAEPGQKVEIGAVIGIINTNVSEKPITSSAGETSDRAAETVNTSPPEVSSKTEEKELTVPSGSYEKTHESSSSQIHISPLARKILQANQLTGQDLIDFYRNFRITREDVQQFLRDRQQPIPQSAPAPSSGGWSGSRETERKRMSTLRLKLSERLVAVKNQTAMLTTFNEVNMTPIITIRNKYKDAFKEKFGVSLGFMSFFTKAVTIALQHFPQVNAQIDGEDIVYHNYADIGIAVSAPKGLMVPIIRNAETLMLHEIEAAIKELANKARTGKLSIEEMTGGTFTITNGGVFGSMLSTPIINPPQSAILGMHNIVERPIAVNGKVEIHPVMYVALSYDHRIIDGRESVSFLVKVKEMLEDPIRMLFHGEDPVKTLLGL